MRVFVTVGTTKFDGLIQTVLSDQVQEALLAKRYSSLVLQIGKTGIKVEDIKSNKLKVEEVFNLKPSLEEDIAKADLVIAHAGAGTCLEVLNAGKALIVVVNEDLMGNHQIELATKLARDNHLAFCVCSTLESTILTLDPASLTPYTKGDVRLFTAFIDNLMGFETD